MPDVGGIALPMLLLLGGVVLGILLALVCRLLVDVDGARAGRRGRPAAARGDAEVADELVVEPVEAELDGLPHGARRPRRALAERSRRAVHSRAATVVHGSSRSTDASRRTDAGAEGQDVADADTRSTSMTRRS